MDPAKAVHFFTLAHYDAFSPFSARHAISSDSYAYENGINLPAGYAHCEQCGICSVPGLTSSVRVVYSKTARAKKRAKNGVTNAKDSQNSPKGARSRSLHATCLACRYVKIHHCLISRKSSTMADQNSEKTDKTGRKKKKKRSELASLLEEKKKAQSSRPLLSFMDFMQ